MDEEIWKSIKFVTGNENKVREAREILGMEIEPLEMENLYELQSTDVHQVIVHKVNEVYQRLKVPVMVEDSGLLFSAWYGLPGALVKWFEKTVGCEGMIKMLDPFDSRDAFALCVVAVHDGREIKIARGEVKGTIALETRGENGFGWDSIFIPDGETRTYGEMQAEEKNAVSHRRRALENLKKQFLRAV